MMFKTKCAHCGKEMFTYAKNKAGTLPTVFCSKACEANKKYQTRWYK